MTELFDDELLKRFMCTFYGFGNYKGDYMLIGMEEAGGNTFEHVQTRLSQWAKHGKSELEDLVRHATALGWAEKYFGKKPHNQPTWNKLIRSLLSAAGQKDVDLKDVKAFQRGHLGRHNDNHCLLELFPLPSPSTKNWMYATYSRLSFLKDRKAYRNELAPSRIAHIQKQIIQFRPKAVLFYGSTYLNWWQMIAEVDLVKQADDYWFGKGEYTNFFVTKHPTATGVTNDYFHRVGEEMR
jgi:hypothetical protein